MGQKTHPKGFRLGINETWDSKWFSQRNFAEFIQEDYKIRNYIKKRLPGGAISKIEIERTSKLVTITIHTGRPGVVIGRKGVAIDRLKNELQLAISRDVMVNIQEVKERDLDATLIAENVIRQIEQRISYRRAMKRAIDIAMKMGAKGIKIACKGRLMGAEIAREEWYRKGRVPLHTIRVRVDYASMPARTKSGAIGIKVWLYKE